MDDKWFKAQQKRAGVTADDIAARIGRDRSVVSKIYSGHRTMTLEWAQAFSEVLNVPLPEILERAGAAPRRIARQLQPGYADSDVVLWIAQGAEDRQVPPIASALGQRAGVDIWQVKSSALALMGYMPGDFILVDTNTAERTKAGDPVVAQVHDNGKGSATFVLRRFEPPVLVAASTAIEDRRVHVVDGVNVVIKGKVISSWRF